VIIRPAVPSDLPFVAQTATRGLARELGRDGLHGACEALVLWAVARGWCRVSALDETILGYSLAGEACLLRIHVKALYRGRGLARALLEDAARPGMVLGSGRGPRLRDLARARGWRIDRALPWALMGATT
jgi:GNAT superfamily N-acetyltransferase